MNNVTANEDKNGRGLGRGLQWPFYWITFILLPVYQILSSQFPPYRSANVTLELVPPVGTEGPPLVGQLTIGALLGLVVTGALLVVIVLLMLLAAAMLYQRRSRKKKGPTILSNDFEFENMGVVSAPSIFPRIDIMQQLSHHVIISNHYITICNYVPLHSLCNHYILHEILHNHYIIIV